MRFTSRRMVAVVVGAAALGLIAGCAKAPQQEIAAAKAAVEAAKTAEANVYLAGRYQAVEDSLRSALAEVEKQNSAMALARNYTAATSKLQSVVSLGAALKTDAPAAKAAMKKEIEASIAAEQAALTAVKDQVKKAPKGKMSKDAKKAFDASLAAADSALAQASAVLAQGNLSAAKEKVAAAQAKGASISAEMSAPPAEKAKAPAKAKKK